MPWRIRNKFIQALFMLLLLLAPVFGSDHPDKYSAGPYTAVETAAGAEEDEISQGKKAVRAKLIADTTAIVPGKPFRLGVRLYMQPHWHTYYKESGDAGQATRILWELPAGFQAGELTWQKPSRFEDAGIVTFGYQNQTLIAATITPPQNLPAKTKISISAKVKWLACKEACVPGEGTVKIELPVNGQESQAINQKLFAEVNFNGSIKDLPPEHDPKIEKDNLSLLDDQTSTDGSSDNNLAFILMAAFIGGFILNFMPCVLPVISIKVFSFLKQANEEPQKVFELGAIFSSGIISTFLILACLVIGLQTAGQKIGWGFQFQYPVFIVIMSTIITLFALSMFGVFYIQVSSGQDQLNKLASGESKTATFFKGVLATFLSTPCTAPFLGTALGFAFAQPWWMTILVFLVIGLGMSSPYILLTAKPDWMKFLPKPGAWMEKFKESMGFLLLATVVWLLYVLGNQVGFSGAIATLAFLVCLSFLAWLTNSFIDLSSSSGKKARVYLLAAILFGLSFRIFLAPYPELLSVDPAVIAKAAQRKAGQELPANADGISWQPFSLTAFNKEVAAHKTIFLDFTADWCLTCKTNELTVLSTPPVVQKFKDLKVVAFKLDWTTQDPEITKLLRKFGRSGVPLYVIFPAGRANSPLVLPEIIDQGLVLQKLTEAGASQ